MEVKPGSVWRHVKRGTEYVVWDLGMMQDSRPWPTEHAHLHLDGHAVVIYYPNKRTPGEENQHKWVRPLAEFTDGRFELVSNPGKTRRCPECSSVLEELERLPPIWNCPACHWGSE